MFAVKPFQVLKSKQCYQLIGVRVVIIIDKLNIFTNRISCNCCTELFYGGFNHEGIIYFNTRIDESFHSTINSNSFTFSQKCNEI